MSAAPSTSSARSRTLKLVGNVLAIVGVVFVAVTFRRHLAAMPALVVDTAVVGAVVGGIVANGAALVLAAVAWRALLTSVGEHQSVRAVYAVIGRANLAKYVPGNVFHLVGRASLAATWGLSLPVIVATMTVETLIVIGVSGVIGAPAAFARAQVLMATLAPAFPPLMLAAVVVAAVLVALAAVAVVLRRRGVGISAGAIVVVIVCDVITSFMLGSAVHLLLTTSFPSVALPWWLCVSGFSLAWVLGFVTPGAPGGVGVREAVFVVLVAPAVGSARADEVAAAIAAVVVIGRLQSIVADVVGFVVARAVDPERRSA